MSVCIVQLILLQLLNECDDVRVDTDPRDGGSIPLIPKPGGEFIKAER